MPTQMETVIGRRIRPRYREGIEAMLPYLPALKSRQEDIDYREKLAEYERKGLQLREKEIEQAEEAAKRGNLLSLGALGLQTGVGITRNKALERAIGAPEAAIPSAKNLAGAEGMIEGTSAVAPLGEALKTWQPYAAGGTGALIGKAFGGDRKKQALIGAAAGGGAALLFSGGDPYSAAVGAILGGIGGGIF